MPSSPTLTAAPTEGATPPAATTPGAFPTGFTVTGSADSLDLWYALTDDGAIAAAEGPTDAPSASFTPQRDGTFLDADPTGGRGDVVLTFGDDTVTVEHGTITVTARKNA